MIQGNREPVPGDCIQVTNLFPVQQTVLHSNPGTLAKHDLLLVGENAVITRLVAPRRNYLYVKRIVDICLSLLGIVFFLSWLTPLLALLIKAGSRGPVFFRQVRLGHHSKPFTCYKFRSMRCSDDADERPASRDDDRITPLGIFLRKSYVDELPQLWNVLKGQMSIIGPRPHMISDCSRFAFIIRDYRFRTLVKPGITGLAQIKGCHGPAWEKEDIINRYRWDVVYVRKAGLSLDLKILLTTLLTVCRVAGKRKDSKE